MEQQEAERLNRIEALNLAVRHRLRDETPADAVNAAEKYLQFLQGPKAPAPSGGSASA